MLSPYYHIDQATGISIHLYPNGEFVIDICKVVVNKNQLSFDQKLVGIKNLNDLTKYLSPKVPVAMNLTGKGILSKQIAQTAPIDPSNFSEVLPNAEYNDFYVQQFISSDQSFVSVIRKLQAEQWINRLKELGFKPMQLSLDAFPLAFILPQLNIYTQDVTINGHLISRNERNEWTDYKKETSSVIPASFKVQQEEMEERLLLPYAAAFGLAMADRVTAISAQVPILITGLKRELDNKKFKVQVAVLLFTLFVLLLINLMVFSWLSSANQKLTTQVGMLSQNSVDKNTIEDQIRQKESLLLNIGWDHGVRKSLMIDQLGELLPSGIIWTAVEIDPLDKANSGNLKAITFSKKQIKISGTSTQVMPINEWMARIKTKDWVKAVQMENYNFNHEINTGQFTIIINY